MVDQNPGNYTYTTSLENEMWNIILSEDYDESTALDFLNSTAFRSFGESLANTVQKKMPEGVKKGPQAYLKKCAQDKNIEITSVNTYTNWFKHGSRPKKSQDSRDTMFRIAFSLDLNTEETVDLFHKIYLDRAFDHRRYQEVIFYYCIEHGLPYQHALEMISKVHFEGNEKNDQTLKTVLLKESALGTESDEELIRFINTHPHNYNLGRGSVTGQQIVEEYKKRAIKTANTEIERTGRIDEYKNRNRSSVNFMYSVITDQPANNEQGTKTTFKNALLPKEIKQSFPQPAIFANNAPSYEETRKMIILLYSYWAWYKTQFEQNEKKYDDYVDDLNNLLFDANLPLLYAGNPFDWLFMRCTIEEAPLDRFRSILSEALMDDL